MITFTSLGAHGRLGNQLFQYAFLVGVNQRYNLPICLPDLNVQIANNQTCMLNSFNLNYSNLNNYEITNIRREIELKNNGVFDVYNPQNIENIQPGTDFSGLYQSYRYWIDYKQEIKKQFTIKDKNILETASKFINNLQASHNKQIIAIHLRRGDVTGWYNYNEYKKYLKNVLTSIPDIRNYYFCIFSGGGTSLQDDINDINWLKDFYKELPAFEIIQTHNPIIDFALIQLCDKIILGYISTFAWWAAFLSEKEVFAPKIFSTTDETRINYYPSNFKTY